jgi:arylsulfatase A
MNRFFWYYPMVLTHEPFYLTPHSNDWNTGNREEEKLEYFRDMVAYTDYIVGRVINRVKELGLADDTLILFTGDNGTDQRIVSYMEDIGEYPGGKGEMWVPGTHVPLLAIGGNNIQQGKVCDSLVDFSDFLPTLADAAGLSLDRYTDLDGQSFLHHLTGNEGPERDWIYCHYIPDSPGLSNIGNFTTGRMVYGKKYKLYRTGDIYDIENDIFEKNPLSKDDPAAINIRNQYSPIFETRPSWESSENLMSKWVKK